MSQAPVPPPVPHYGIAPRRKGLKAGVFGWFIFIAIALVLFMLLQNGSSHGTSIPLSDFQSLLRTDKVSELTVEGSRITGIFSMPQNIRGKSVLRFQTEIPKEAVSWQFTQWLLEQRGDAIVNVNNNSNLLLDILVPLIPWLLIFGFIWFFVFRQLRRGAQVPFAGYSQQPPPPPPFIPPAPPLP